MTDTAVITQAYFTDETLGKIKSFDDAIALATAHGPLESIADYGNGFAVLKDKAVLVGVPFVILEWQEREGEFGEGFTSALVVTKNGDKYVVNDGSTGIAAQLADVTARRVAEGVPNDHAFLAVPQGLTRSDYYRHETTGEIARTRPADGGKAWVPATTFYLA